MLSAEKRELGGLAAAVIATAALSRHLPRRVGLADLLLGGAVLLLLQGLARDLGRLWRERTRLPRAARAHVKCICTESALGVTSIVAGTVILFAWAPIFLPVQRAAWPLGVLALGTFGFLTRDLVLDWRAWKVRRAAH